MKFLNIKWLIFGLLGQMSFAVETPIEKSKVLDEAQFTIIASVVDNPPALCLSIKNTKHPEPVLLEWFPVGGIECDVLRKGEDPKDEDVEELCLGRMRIGPASYALLPPERVDVSTVAGVFFVRLPLDKKIDTKQLIDGKVQVRLRFLILSDIPSATSTSSATSGFLAARRSWSSRWITISEKKETDDT